MQTKVLDAQTEARVRESFARQGFMRHLGAEMTGVKYGEVEIRVPFREELTQQHAYFHGGVSAAIADTATGYAAFTTMAADSSVIAVEFKINLVAPAEGEALVARGRVLRAGRFCGERRHGKAVRDDALDDYGAGRTVGPTEGRLAHVLRIGIRQGRERSRLLLLAQGGGDCVRKDFLPNYLPNSRQLRRDER